MGKFGKVDYKQFKELQKKLEKFDKLERQKICEDSAKELGRSLYARAKRKTPVGVYPASSGKTGGTLRRNWAMESTPLANGYQVDVFNPTEYAPFVEYGHRTRGHKGWVPGRHMLTQSEIEVEKNVPRVVDKHIQKALEELFDD